MRDDRGADPVLSRTATRRQFAWMSGAMLVAAAAGCAPAGEASTAVSPSPLPGTPPLASNQVRVALPAVGQTVGAIGQLLGDLPVAVTRLDASTVVAVSRVCTHEGCTVDLPTASLGHLECPCHGSRFDVRGTVINGPAERALASFPTELDAAGVLVTLPKA